MFMGDIERAAEWCERTLPVAERHNDVAVIANALTVRGVLALFTGRPREARAIQLGAFRLAQENDLIYEQIRISINLSACDMDVDPALALEDGEKGLVLARRYGFRVNEAFLISNVMDALVMQGDREAAEGLLAEVELEEMPDHLRSIVSPVAAELWAWQGDTSRAASEMDWRDTILAGSTSLQDRIANDVGRLVIGLVDGSHESVLEGIDISIAEKQMFSNFFARAADAALWGRDEKRLGEILEMYERVGPRGPLCDNHRLTMRAGMAALEGNMEAAAQHFREAVRVWESLGCKVELALTQIGYLLATGDEDARRAGTEAKEFFASWGNRRLVAMIDSHLAEVAEPAPQ
jgi:hypothetical protein